VGKIALAATAVVVGFVYPILGVVAVGTLVALAVVAPSWRG